MNKIRDEKGETATDTEEIQKIMRAYIKKNICIPSNWKM